MANQIIRLPLTGCNQAEVSLYALEEQNVLKIKYLDGGFSVFWNGSREMGLMDRQGRITIQPAWDQIYVEYEWGQIRCVKGGTTVLFDLNGQTLSGMAPEKQCALGSGVAVKDIDGSVKMMRKLSAFSEGLARCYQDKNTYYVDPSGTVSLVVNGFECGDFQNGLAVFRKRNGFFKRDTYGYVRTSGAIAVQSRYWNALPFRCGVAVVEDERGKHFLNESGTEFSCYRMQDGKRIELPFPTQVGEFVNDYAAVLFLAPSRSVVLDGVPFSAPQGEGGYAVVHRSGQITTSKLYNHLVPTGIGDRFIFNEYPGNDGKKRYGLMDAKGNVLLRPAYDSLEPKGSDCFLLEKDGAYGLADRFGHVITEPQWEKLMLVRGGSFNVFRNGQWGVMDLNGKWLYELGQTGPYFVGPEIMLMGKNDRFQICNRNREPVLSGDVKVRDVLTDGLLLVLYHDQYWLMELDF